MLAAGGFSQEPRLFPDWRDVRESRQDDLTVLLIQQFNDRLTFPAISLCSRGAGCGVQITQLYQFHG